MVSSSANAAEWTVGASINQNISFNDNVQMQKEAKGSVIYQIVPVINFAHKTEISQIQATASYGTQRYLDIPELDRNLQNYSFGSYYLTERSRWGLNATFNVDPARNTATQDSGNFISNAEKITWSVSPSVSYKLTELDSLNLLPSYSKTTYSTNDFSDNEYSGISLTWERQWTEGYSSSINLAYSKFDSTGSGSSLGTGTNSNSYSINVSNTFRWSENLTLAGTLGGRLTESENKTFFGTSKNSSTGLLADVAISYKGENYSTAFNLSRSLTPSSTGQLNEQSRVGLNLHYDITERLSASALGSYQTTKSASSNEESISRKNFSIQPAINWKMVQDWTISASYSYNQQDSGTQNGGAVDSNLFMVSINYNWQGLSFSR